MWRGTGAVSRGPAPAHPMWLTAQLSDGYDARMQFGIFSVSDVSTDPTTGRTISEADRIQQMVAPLRQGEESASTCSPPASTTIRRSCPPPHHPARVHRGPDRADHPVDRDDAHHDQRPGQDRRGLRDAPASRGRAGRPHAGAWQHRAGVSVVRPGHPQRDPAGGRELRPAPPSMARGRGRLAGAVPHPLTGFTSTP